MPKYEELLTLARLCLAQACGTSNRDVAEELTRMAKEYQRKAAALDGGKLPEVGIGWTVEPDMLPSPRRLVQ